MIKNFFSTLLLCITINAFATEKGPAIQDYPFEKVSNNAWVIHGPLGLPSVKNQGFMNNPGIVLTKAGIVIIDPGSSVQAGEMVLKMIKQVSDQPVVAVFNTHVHGDHWLGNQAVRAAYPNATIYGHPKMIAAIKEGAGDDWVELMNKLTEGATLGTKVVSPDHAVKNGDEIKLGDTTFRIHHYGLAHTITDIMIESVEESVVFLGDNALANRIPRMSDGNFKGAMNSINEILKTSARVYVPGHGPTGDAAMVKTFNQYLSLIYQAAKKAFDKDLDSSDVKNFSLKTTSQYKNWSGYEEQVYRHGAQAYMEIEAAEF